MTLCSWSKPSFTPHITVSIKLPIVSNCLIIPMKDVHLLFFGALLLSLAFADAMDKLGSK